MENTKSFMKWYNEIADIPTKSENGTWYDAETGFTYSEYKNPRPVKKRSTSKKSQRLLKLYDDVKSIQAKEWKNVTKEEKKFLYESLQTLRKNKFNV